MLIRVLFAVTLMSMLWFDASATTRTQHNTTPGVRSNAAAPEISSVSQRAEQGDAQAEYQLGSFYRTGTNVRLDYQQALKWYRRAAERNYPDAEFALGFMYEQGEGIKQILVPLPGGDLTHYAQSQSHLTGQRRHGIDRRKTVVNDRYTSSWHA